LGASVGKSYGLLAGGKDNGEVDIYDPYAIITGKTKDPVAKHAAFSGPVKGLDFSPLNPGMLATGGPDGEVKAASGFYKNMQLKHCKRS
jgi:protein transport protein SEC31